MVDADFRAALTTDPEAALATHGLPLSPAERAALARLRPLLDLSRRITGQIMRALQDARKAPGHDRIYVADEKEHEKKMIIQEQCVPVNPNLRQELQIMRDELNIAGYETHF